MASLERKDQLNHRTNKSILLRSLQFFLSSLNIFNGDMVISALKPKLSPRITEGRAAWGLLQAARLFFLCLLPSTVLAADFAGSLKSVSITDASGTNQPPVAVINYTKVGAIFTFDASGSSDPDGTIAAYKWDFGDGSSGAGQTVAHEFKTGTYSINLQIVDNSGGTSVSATTIQKSPPAWGGEIANRWAASSSLTTTNIPLSSGLMAGARSVVFVNWIKSGKTLAKVQDSKGNIYSIDKYLNFLTSYNIAIASAYITTPLASNDAITLTWGGTSGGASLWGAVGSIMNANPTSSTDVTCSATNKVSSISASAETTTPETAIVSSLFLVNPLSVTYSPGNWNTIGSAQSVGTHSVSYMHTEETTIGTKNMGGVLSAPLSWGAIWVAYK